MLLHYDMSAHTAPLMPAECMVHEGDSHQDVVTEKVKPNISLRAHLTTTGTAAR